jgi:protein-disulfide isomerase
VGVGAALYTRSQKKEQAAVQAATPAPPASVLVRPHSHILGPADAKVTIVEFLDPECESCREVYPMVKHLLSQYGGRVRLVVRYMPFHPNSMYAAAALEAAAEQNKYWEMLETLFRHQPEWGGHHAPRPELIPEYAKQLGLDMDAWTKAVGKGEYKALVERDREDGKSLGVKGTPTFFVNGKMLDQLGYEPLMAMIEAELGNK